MDEAPRPTIKGIFVKSHIRGLERERGADAVRELEKKVGHPLDYKSTDNVPISDEVLILEHIVDIMSGSVFSQKERELEAGRLHFRNFATTPLWLIVDSILGSNPRFILMQSSKIAGHVFQDVQFVSEDLGEEGVKITMFNNDYPLEHFQGFFEEFMRSFSMECTVSAVARSRDRYEYTIKWSE